MKQVYLLDHVSIVDFDDSAILLDSKKSNYYGLNNVAADFFAFLQELDSTTLSAEKISAKYEVPLEVVQSDLNLLITELIQLGFVNEVSRISPK